MHGSCQAACPTLAETQRLASATWPAPPLTCCSVIAKEIHVKPRGFLSTFQPAKHRPLVRRTHSFIHPTNFVSPQSPMTARSGPVKTRPCRCPTRASKTDTSRPHRSCNFFFFVIWLSECVIISCPRVSIKQLLPPGGLNPRDV